MRRPLPADWPELGDEALLDLRLSDLPLHDRGHAGRRGSRSCGEELDARGLALPAALLSLGRVVHARRRHRDRHPLLSRASAPREARRARRCSRSKAASTSGACASCATRPGTRSTTRSGCGCAASAARSSARPSSRIPSSTRRKPYSKSFVLHLDAWYAQSHPDEDFAETFAVWLTPNSEWRQRYAGWPALKKLEYMDALMQSLRGQTPRVAEPRRRSIRCATLRTTLRQHYRNKRRHYGVDYPNFYDRDLRRLFSDAPEFAGNITAAQFIARIRRPVAARRRRAGPASTSTRSTRCSRT